MKRALLLLPLFLQLSGCGPSGSGPEKGGISTKVDERLSAEELSRQFTKDRKATNERYAGKKLLLEGTVFKTGFTSNSIHGIDARTVELDGPKADIKCFLKKDERAEDLEKGMKVKVAGSYLKADLYPMLKDCEVEILDN